jgi:hypothetical protein
MKELYNENYNHWSNKSKKTTEDGKLSQAHGLAELIL